MKTRPGVTAVSVFVFMAACSASLFAQKPPALCVAAPGAPQPIIDVHMHARPLAILPAVSAELDRHQVIAVVLSSLKLELTTDWATRDRRFIPSLAFRESTMPADEARRLVKQGVVRAFGELGFQYAGLRPDDPSLDQYFTLAEELDIPVAIHMSGGGLPDEPRFRVALGNPLLLEEVLIRHPKLRVNLMHAGLPYLEGTLAIMRRYPLVYADLSKISDATAYPRGQFQDYLRSLMRAGLGGRLMHGSDAAGVENIGTSIEGIRSALFLSDGERRAILCDNAARFFRLGGNRE